MPRFADFGSSNIAFCPEFSVGRRGSGAVPVSMTNSNAATGCKPCGPRLFRFDLFRLIESVLYKIINIDEVVPVIEGSAMPSEVDDQQVVRLYCPDPPRQKPLYIVAGGQVGEFSQRMLVAD